MTISAQTRAAAGPDAGANDQRAELTATRRELRGLTYAISHDLRAPLRAISGFSHALIHDNIAQLDEQGQFYLGRINAGVEWMASMIAGLLELSRLHETPLHREHIDLSAVASDIVHELRVSDPDRAVGFSIQDDIVVEADPTLLRVLLEHLICNAWKFTSTRPYARIEIAARVDNGERIFVVRDDGVGFDPRRADRQFTPFQRLHAEEDFPGLGMGLAVAQVIVRRHGGRIWAAAEPDRGASFFFTLPHP